MAKINEPPTPLLPPNGDQEQDQNDEQGPTRCMDPELRVMGSMLRQLEELDEPARGRVVRWLTDRYEGRPQ